MDAEKIIKSSVLGDLPAIPDITNKSQSFLDSNLFVMSISLFILGVIVLLLSTYLIKHGKEPVDVLKALGIPLIVISAVLIILTGFGAKELSPVIGLLGTIAGYLLGRTENEINRKGEAVSHGNNTKPNEVAVKPIVLESAND